jgi:hypothetical protein
VHEQPKPHEAGHDISKRAGPKASFNDVARPTRHVAVSYELRWSRIMNFPGSLTSVPEAAGVYAFAKVATTLTLPVTLEWVYVGESKNLRARLSNHRALQEANELLASWLRVNKSGVEVWYAVTDVSKRKQVERTLIQELAPVFNKIKYKGGSK